MTNRYDHELAAAELFASKVNGSSSYWRAVSPKPGRWYDWADPATGQIGQCCMGDGGRWLQAPMGEHPVVLAWDGHRHGRHIVR